MADKIRVNTKSLGTTRDNVRDQIRKIREEIKYLEEDVIQLNGMWEGPAHEAFNTAFLADVRTLSSQCGVLDGIVSYETNAVKEYDACENKVASLVAGIRV